MLKTNIIMRRILATLIDVLILFLSAMLMLIVLGSNPEQIFASALISNMVGLGTLSLLEIVCVAVWGRTPGQAMLGIEVLNKNGTRVSLSKSLLRGLLIFVEGSLLGFPFYGILYIAWGINLIKLVVSGTTFWDEQVGTVVVKHAQSQAKTI
jgi:uncharacterized RDD family membrane protein YckC